MHYFSSNDDASDHSAGNSFPERLFGPVVGTDIYLEGSEQFLKYSLNYVFGFYFHLYYTMMDV